jgi:hypothetical protein
MVAGFVISPLLSTSTLIIFFSSVYPRPQIRLPIRPGNTKGL